MDCCECCSKVNQNPSLAKDVERFLLRGGVGVAPYLCLSPAGKRMYRCWEREHAWFFPPSGNAGGEVIRWV